MDNEPAPQDPRVVAYEAMKASKSINASQLLVCGVLATATEPMTRNEIAQRIVADGHTVSASGIGSRAGELAGLGVLRELPKRRCKVSEVTVATFEMTGNLPTKELLPTRFTRRQLLRALEAGFRAIAYLKLPVTITVIAKELGVEESMIGAAIQENLDACNANTPAPVEGEEKPGRRKKAVAAEAAPAATAPETSSESPQEPSEAPERPVEPSEGEGRLAA